VTAAQAMGLVGQPNVALIDLRERAEREKHGVIPASCTRPTPTCREHRPGGMLHELAAATPKRIVFYCAFGERSAWPSRLRRMPALRRLPHPRGIDAWRQLTGRCCGEPTSTSSFPLSRRERWWISCRSRAGRRARRCPWGANEESQEHAEEGQRSEGDQGRHIAPGIVPQQAGQDRTQPGHSPAPSGPHRGWPEARTAEVVHQAKGSSVSTPPIPRRSSRPPLTLHGRGDASMSTVETPGTRGQGQAQTHPDAPRANNPKQMPAAPMSGRTC